MTERIQVELAPDGGGMRALEVRPVKREESSTSRYVLGDLLHAGTSAVFRAHHRHMDREVVVKRYAGLTMDDADARHRLARVGALCHPNTARILDVGGAGGSVFVVREYFEGKTLACHLQAGLRLEGKALASLATQLLKSLGEAHARGLAHGSLCPEHILVAGSEDEAYFELLDYESAALGLPLSAHAMAYAPPGVAPSALADLQALAMVLRSASTGLTPAWSGRTWPAGGAPTAEVLERVLHGELADAAAFEAAFRAACGGPAPRSPDPLLSFGHYELLAEQPPMLWVFSDGPSTSWSTLAEVWNELEPTYEVVRLDAVARARALEDLRTGRSNPPWLVVFSDLHVLLGDPLLECLQQTGEVGRVLVSTHPNYDLLEATVNGCGLDRQVCLPAEPDVIVTAVQRSMAVIQKRREHYDELRRRVRLERAQVQALVRSLAETG